MIEEISVNKRSTAGRNGRIREVSQKQSVNSAD
jgi:hypothetical protein